MNNNLYYLKYLKYKTKYLNEKNRISGGGCDIDNSKERIEEELNKFNIISRLKENFMLLKSVDNSLEDYIIKTITSYYNDIVVPLTKLKKKCLKPVFSSYLWNKVLPALKCESTMEILNGTYQSLNIVEDPQDTFKDEIKYTKNFSRGTALILNFISNYEERNFRYLTNLFNIKFKLQNSQFIESMRFGTPYSPKDDPKDELENDSEDEHKEIPKVELKDTPTDKDASKVELEDTSTKFYKKQIEILKKYIKDNNKKCLFISLLDPCEEKFCKFAGGKKNESKMIHNEIDGYNDPDIVYLNMPCNNSVNLKTNLSAISDKENSEKLDKYFDRLKVWLTEKIDKTSIIIDAKTDKTPITMYTTLDKLINNNNFFEKFKNNVKNNDTNNPDLKEKLAIKKFVIKEKIKNKITMQDFLIDFKKYSPCEEDLTNENIRLAMCCYISLIFFLLSKDKPNTYILLYHCKSGQDRTGTFYAINQMVNEITQKNYDKIIIDINDNKSFIEIFYKYFSLTQQINTTTSYYITSMKSTKKYCPTTFEADKDYKIINKDVKQCYLKYLFFSYNITITSTGCPGLKWSLGNKNLPIKYFDKRDYFTFLDSAVDNRFPYLLTENSLIAWFFKGASDMRGD
jgi:hypothetical protein